jgi:hypothetical protein
MEKINELEGVNNTDSMEPIVLSIESGEKSDLNEINEV